MSKSRRERTQTIALHLLLLPLAL
ncbi:MAG: hypothetical protein K0R85_1254, partial [Devosia sp.]|nr:hypothetical protein [Devosia sp.]